MEHRPVLRVVATSSIRAGSFLATGSEDKDELVVAEMDLDKIEEVRRVWQFYRDRRPDSYGADGGAAPMTLLIKNGTIVTATDEYRGDVFVDGEKITTIGTSLTMPADRVIDAAGKYVLPGGIDVHTHLDMPFGGTTSADDFESGTIAAAHGGTTTIVDFAIQYKGETLHHALGNVDEEGRGQGGDRLRLPHDRHRPVRSGRDRDGRARPPGRDLVQAVHGLPGRLHARRREHLPGDAADGQERRDDLHARRERRRDRRAGQEGPGRGQDGAEVPRAHRPARAEAEATHRAIALAEIADVPIYIVHLSAAEALEMVTEARDRGLPAYAETCPQYLFLSYDNYEEPGFEGAKYVMSRRFARRRRRTGCGAASRSTTCRRSRPTTARSA